MSAYHQMSHRVRGPGLRDGMTDSQATKGVEVVYYLQLPNGTIKIGTSSDILARLGKHRRKYGKVRVLAIEFGGRSLEAQRHQEFAGDRIGAAEHFHPSDTLMSHIKMLAVLDRFC